jgi:hypothetical protein
MMKTPVLILGTLLMVAAADNIDAVAKQLKTTRGEIESMIKTNIGHASFAFPYSSRLVPVDKRADVVKALAEFSKAYTKSEAFMTWYGKYREEEKPKAQADIKPAADQRKEQVEQIKKSIAENEKAYQQATGDMKEVYRQALETMKLMLQQTQNAPAEQDQMMDQMAGQANQDAKKEYEQKLAAWNKDYPAGNPKPLLRRRIQEFLDVTQGVDFGAELVKNGDKLLFKNPDYERKDYRFKLGFRAGKAATETARTFAQAWLKELGKE